TPSGIMSRRAPNGGGAALRDRRICGGNNIDFVLFIGGVEEMKIKITQPLEKLNHGIFKWLLEAKPM
ncbi:MAG: hypothetical protein QGI11_15020, partial [Nitrospinota bacterium]|nr:hypothetical protein [Nitrospinota bacterium]